MDLKPGDRVLHLPCGDGALCREISPLVPLGLVVGVDPSDDAVRAARYAARDLDNVMFACSDPGEIPWKEDFFSHAVIVAEAAVPLKEVYRVLADGGRAFVTRGDAAVLEAVGFADIQVIADGLVVAAKR